VFLKLQRPRQIKSKGVLSSSCGTLCFGATLLSLGTKTVSDDVVEHCTLPKTTSGLPSQIGLMNCLLLIHVHRLFSFFYSLILV